MKRSILISACVALTAVQLFAVARLYQSASIVGIQQKTNTRVLYYIVNTPITKDEPYYEISVQLKDMVYIGRYIPRHPDDALPEEWTPGATVQVRLDNRHLYMKRPSGADLDLAVIKQTAVKAAPEGAPAAK
jgi:hypothetical protein